MIPFYGQSNLDLSIQLTGSLDNFISFCNINNVTDIDKTVSNYNDSNTILNSLNVGYRYATKNKEKSVDVGDYDSDDYSSDDYNT